MFNPCGCGNPLEGAKWYRLKYSGFLRVFAKKMDRDFLAKGFDTISKGNAGQYLVEWRGIQYIFDSNTFEETYELVAETSTTS